VIRKKSVNDLKASWLYTYICTYVSRYLLLNEADNLYHFMKTHTCMYVCMPEFRVWVLIHTYVHTYMCTFVCVYAYACIHMYVWACLSDKIIK